MKRTIDDIYRLITYKRECAINEAHGEAKKGKERDRMFIERLYGEIDAYTDILILIETSHILKEE